MATPAFPSFMQVPARVPVGIWRALRAVSVLAAITVGVALIVEPDTGLVILWGFLVPVLPLVFFVAPGLWRNLCPLAAANQTPRLFKFTRGWTLPPRAKEYAYVIGIVLFATLVPLRKVLFNTNGPASAALVLGTIGLAFAGGLAFKGRSGWCSTFCPLLPVQRIYGQTPFVSVRNSHCEPCVGCTKNCYDFNPEVAYLADLYDDDRHYTAYRKFFVGAFPGFIIGFYQVPNVSVGEVYLQMGSYVLLSAGSFYLLDAFVKVTTNKLTAIYAMAALNAYYWFNVPRLCATLETQTGAAIPDATIWVARGLLAALALWWIARSYRKERRFLAQALTSRGAKVGAAATPTMLRAKPAGGAPEVTIVPGDRRVVVEAGKTVLEVVEAAGCAIESGCRMGICGADPVAIVQGAEHLSPIGGDEQSTLDRLGLAPNTRMACCARVRGPVTVSLKPDRPTAPRALTIVGFVPDVAVKRVVILGHGIAGLTAADYVRRYHPAAEVHLVGQEPHHLYNRMAITRLVYGRSAMQGLYLQPESWYEEHKITSWLNTRVESIAPADKTVLLGTGETLPYDRLILALGSRSFVPKIEGYGAPGTCVLREANDAIELRSYVQKHSAHRAVVGGGGLLGLEAAYALHKLGVRVTVLERADRLLPMQLDARSSELLRAYLEGLGLGIMLGAEVVRVHAAPRMTGVDLKDGRSLDAEILLLAAGIQPNVEIAAAAGLTCKRGVVVDDAMRTSAPDIYAVGDIAEHRGKIQGLWTTAVDQAKVAAVNAVGGDRTYEGTLPSTILKVAGIDLMSMGRVEPGDPDEMPLAVEDAAQHTYRKLLIARGRIAGAILLGHPALAQPILHLIKKEVDISASTSLAALRAGDWEALKKLAAT